MAYFISGFEVIFHWQYLGYMFAGVFWGMLLGFLPGLHGGIGMTLMLPVTYGMEALAALVFMLSIYTGGIFGGAVTAILFNTPGSAANIATTFDGYPMSKRGEPERAMGLALMSSFLGGIIGSLSLLLLAQPMARFAVKFGPGEMFMITILGVSVIGCLSNNMMKSLFSGCIGLLMGTVGTSITGFTRGTWGSAYLFDGIPIVPAFLGFLALPEIYEQIMQPVKFSRSEEKTQNIFLFMKGQLEVLRHFPRVFICSVAGVIVGILPAAGGSIASLLCYYQSKLFSKKPERYGTGIPEGIISCESSNNAAEGGSLTTMFVLGIPGSSSTAILLGALVLQGWMPGPKLFFDHGEIIYASISSLFVQQFVMWFLGAGFCLMGARIVRLRFAYLLPCVMIFIFIGAFSGRSALFDIGLMLFFSGVGVLMKLGEYPIPPLILGLLLGGLADIELIRVLQSFDRFIEIFNSPITSALFVFSLVSMMWPLFFRRKSGQ